MLNNEILNMNVSKFSVAVVVFCVSGLMVVAQNQESRSVPGACGNFYSSSKNHIPEPQDGNGSLGPVL